MKILILHTYYQQRGGEDECFEAEAAMLREAGHQVETYVRHNSELESQSKLQMARNTIWNHQCYSDVTDLLQHHQPDIMHVNNLFPLMSPAVFQAAHRCGVATVASLQNYRYFCPGTLLYRDGKKCTECRGRRIAWPGIRHGCYRNSPLATAVVAAQQTTHRMLGSWSYIDRYFAVSEATRTEHVKAGFPAEQMIVKPNFVQDDPGSGSGDGGYAVFAGRLTEEKGVRLLLDT